MGWFKKKPSPQVSHTRKSSDQQNAELLGFMWNFKKLVDQGKKINYKGDFTARYTPKGQPMKNKKRGK
jgi:hypothetical protein